MASTSEGVILHGRNSSLQLASFTANPLNPEPLISYLIAQAAISYTPALSLPPMRHYVATSAEKGWVGRDSNPEPTP